MSEIGGVTDLVPFIVLGIGSCQLSHTVFCFFLFNSKRAHTYTHQAKRWIHPGGACLSGNQWSVWWGPLSVVMKLRGRPSTHTTNLTWPQLTRHRQHRQPERWEQSQSNWINHQHSQTNQSLFYSVLSLLHSVSPASSLFLTPLSGSPFSIYCFQWCLFVRKCSFFHLKSSVRF